MNVIQSGSFTATGNDVRLDIRSDVDWMWVNNYTQIADTNDVGVKYFWQRGMADGTGIRYFKSGGGDNLNVGVLASPNGFQLLDTSGPPLGPAIAVTAGTNVVQPVISTGNTQGLVTGSVIRLIQDGGTTAPNITAVDFEIDNVVSNTSFRVRYPLANAPGAVFGTGIYRKVNFDPIYYPRTRFIADISQATQAVVQLTVQHGYVVGQLIRFTVPPQFGMVELDNVQATIVATTASTITVDVDTSAFTAYQWPLAAGFLAVTWAKTHPVGEDTAEALSAGTDILSDATRNTAILGMLLPGGADRPGGDALDDMYWIAGRSDVVQM